MRVGNFCSRNPQSSNDATWHDVYGHHINTQQKHNSHFDPKIKNQISTSHLLEIILAQSIMLTSCDQCVHGNTNIHRATVGEYLVVDEESDASEGWR